MAQFRLTCPECQTSLATNKKVPVGTVLDCPKCGTMFAAPPVRVMKAVAKADDYEVIDDDDEDVEVVDEVEDDVEVVDDDAPVKKKPRPKTAGSRPKGKFKAKKKGPGAGVIVGIVLGGVAGLGVIGGLIFLIMSLLASDEPTVYIPPEAVAVFGADYAALSKTSLGGQLDQLLLAVPPLADYRQKSKTEFKDLFTNFAVGVTSPGGSDSQWILSVKSKMPIDGPALLGSTFQGKADTVGGKSGYRIGPAAAYMPSNKTLVMTNGDDSKIARIFSAPGRSLSGDKKRLFEKTDKAMFWGVVVMDDEIRRQSGAMAGMIPGANDPAVAAITNQMKGVAFRTAVKGGDLEITSYTLMADAAAAQNAVKVMTEQKAKQASNPLAAIQMMAMPGSVGKLTKELEASTKYETEGDFAKSTSTCQLGTLETAVREVADMVGKMAPMMGGPPGAQPGGMPTPRRPGLKPQG